jgi:hypothetical protein
MLPSRVFSGFPISKLLSSMLSGTLAQRRLALAVTGRLAAGIPTDCVGLGVN